MRILEDSFRWLHDFTDDFSTVKVGQVGAQLIDHFFCSQICAVLSSTPPEKVRMVRWVFDFIPLNPQPFSSADGAERGQESAVMPCFAGSGSR